MQWSFEGKVEQENSVNVLKFLWLTCPHWRASSHCLPEVSISQFLQAHGWYKKAKSATHATKTLPCDLGDQSQSTNSDSQIAST